MKGDDILDRLLDLAARIGTIVDALPDTRLGRHVAGQLIRCGTSGPANYNEGRAGESRNDFIHKLSIVLKELRETDVWLKLIIKARLLPDARLLAVVNETEQLGRIIAQSIITAKANRSAKRRVVGGLACFSFFIACFSFFIFLH